jgi:hypothetical protein
METLPFLVPFAGAVALTWTTMFCLGCSLGRRVRRLEAAYHQITTEMQNRDPVETAPPGFIGGVRFGQTSQLPPVIVQQVPYRYPPSYGPPPGPPPASAPYPSAPPALQYSRQTV